MSQSELEWKQPASRHFKRGKTSASKWQFGLVLLVIGWESGASFANQSQGVVKQNQSKRKFTFDTQGLVTSSHNLQLSRNTSRNQKLPSAFKRVSHFRRTKFAPALMSGRRWACAVTSPAPWCVKGSWWPRGLLGHLVSYLRIKLFRSYGTVNKEEKRKRSDWV